MEPIAIMKRAVTGPRARNRCKWDRLIQFVNEVWELLSVFLGDEMSGRTRIKDGLANVEARVIMIPIPFVVRHIAVETSLL